MNKLFLNLFLTLLCLSQLTFAQSKSSNDSSYSIFKFQFSNDFLHQTDHYYSNGFLFEFYHPIFESNPLNYFLVPTDNSLINYYGLTAKQDFFTPTELSDTILQKSDRPFAAYILIGAKKISYDVSNRFRIVSELELGLIGKSALGEETQNGIHSFLPTSSDVSGWYNQIGNDFLINYSVEFEKSIWAADWININAVASTKVGSPFTHFEGGATIRLGKYDVDYLYEHETMSKMNWQAYLFADIRGRRVIYNATLQGGLFNNNSIHTVDIINKWVGDFTLGFAFIHNKFRVEIGQHYITPEYKGAKIHRWGYLNLQVGF